MPKIGVLGRRGEILPYLSAGFVPYESDDAEEATQQLLKAAAECAIVYVTPEFAAALSAEISRYAAAQTPAILALPEKEGGIGMEHLRRTAERAIGADILFREEN